MVIDGLGLTKQSLYLTPQFLMPGLLKMRYETIISELKKCKACIFKKNGVAKAGDGSYRGVGPHPVLGPPGYAWEVKVVPD